jgi:hypothetical protein
LNRLVHARDRPGPHAAGFDLPWVTSAGWAAITTAAFAFLPWRASLGSAGAALSIHLSVLAAGLLALAAALVLALDAPLFAAHGRTASNTALAGAWMLLGASALRAYDANWPAPTLPASFAIGYEAPSWAAAAAVFACLRIDQTWRTRQASAVVLPLVVAALMLDMWLMASAPDMPGLLADVLQAQLGWGWHLGGKLGVAACVVLALWCFASRRPRRDAGERWLRGAMVLGFAGFTLALTCAGALVMLPGASHGAVRRLVAGAAVWIIFALPFMLWRSGRGRREWLVLGLALGIGLAALAYAVAIVPEGLP